MELNGHHPLPTVLAQGSSPPNAILESECIQNQTDPRVKQMGKAVRFVAVGVTWGEKAKALDDP